MKYISLRKQLNLYYKWRKKILKRDNGICQICGSEGKEVHHILSVATHPEMEFIDNNGILLCKNCHSESQTLSSNAWKCIMKWNPNYNPLGAKWKYLRFDSPKHKPEWGIKKLTKHMGFSLEVNFKKK